MCLSKSYLRRRLNGEAEGMGLEPTLNSAATDDGLCGCEKCQSAHAARACTWEALVVSTWHCLTPICNR